MPLKWANSLERWWGGYCHHALWTYGRYVVLIARQGGSRQWEGPTRQALENGLGHVARACSTTAAPGGQLRIYEGTESMAATLRLFRSAAVVVGFHGAAPSRM